MSRSKDPAIVARVPKLPARYGVFVAPLFLSIVMTCLVSCVSTIRGVGLTSNFASTWLAAWGVSWAIAFPVLLAMMPIARRLTTMLTRNA